MESPIFIRDLLSGDDTIYQKTKGEKMREGQERGMTDFLSTFSFSLFHTTCFIKQNIPLDQKKFLKNHSQHRVGNILNAP
jgi:hypothetical protein